MEFYGNSRVEFNIVFRIYNLQWLLRFLLVLLINVMHAQLHCICMNCFFHLGADDDSRSLLLLYRKFGF